MSGNTVTALQALPRSQDLLVAVTIDNHAKIIPEGEEERRRADDDRAVAWAIFSVLFGIFPKLLPLLFTLMTSVRGIFPYLHESHLISLYVFIFDAITSKY